MSTHHLVQLPPDSERVTDADEEIFLLYTNLQSNPTQQSHSNFRGLGHVDSHKDVLNLSFELNAPTPATTDQYRASGHGRSAKRKAKKSVTESTIVQVELAQDTTALRSRKGDTGSVVWKARSIDFAQIILEQARFNLPNAILNLDSLPSANVLELGAGTGLLSIVLSPLVQKYTVTDIEELIPLIKKNLALNFDGWPSSNYGANVVAQPLNWQTIQNTPPSLQSHHFPARSSNLLDLILVVDCIYNSALVPPLIDAINYVSTPEHTAVLIMVELRSEEVLREFLELWLQSGGWDVSRVGGDFISAPYVMWIGIKRKS